MCSGRWQVHTQITTNSDTWLIVWLAAGVVYWEQVTADAASQCPLMTMTMQHSYDYGVLPTDTSPMV